MRVRTAGLSYSECNALRTPWGTCIDRHRPRPTTCRPIPIDPLAGLALDFGGTATRWALVGRDGSLLAQGSVAGIDK